MPEWVRRTARVLGFALLGWVGLSILLVLLFRVVPVFGSMVMVERKLESWVSGEPIDIEQQWRPWPELSDNAKVAVIEKQEETKKKKG